MISDNLVTAHAHSVIILYGATVNINPVSAPDLRNRWSMMKFMIKKAKNKDTRSSGYSGVRGLSASPQLL